MQYAGLKHPGQIHYGTAESVCTEISTTAMFVQILVSSELMIFPVRSLSWMWFNRASTALYVLVIGAAVLFSVLAALGIPHNLGETLGDIFSNQLGWQNTGWAWIWSIGTTLLLDFIKKTWVQVVDGTSEEIQCERVADAAATNAARETTTEAQRLTHRASSALTATGVGAVGGSQRPATMYGVGNGIFSEGSDPASLARAMARSRKSVRRTIA